MTRPSAQQLRVMIRLFYAALREYIKVVGVANDDIAPAELQAFLQKHPVVYPIVQVDPAAPPADFGMAPTLPISWLIDPQGKVAKVYENVDPEKNSAQVLRDLASLKAGG